MASTLDKASPGSMPKVITIGVPFPDGADSLIDILQYRMDTARGGGQCKYLVARIKREYSSTTNRNCLALSWRMGVAQMDLDTATPPSGSVFLDSLYCICYCPRTDRCIIMTGSALMRMFSILHRNFQRKERNDLTLTLCTSNALRIFL